MEKVSIIIPAYNEEKRIGNTLEEYSKFFKKLYSKKGLDYEILVVINNTKDATEDVVKTFQKKDSKISFLNFEKGGKGFAITEGFKDALTRKNDLIGFVDADMATTPESFYDLIKNIGNYGGVIASRGIAGAKANFTLLRKITHKGFNFIIRVFLFLHYKDTQCGAKIFRKNVIKRIINKIGVTEWAYDIDLLYNLGKENIKIKELPTVWKDKSGSKVNVIKTSVQMFLAVIRLRLIYSPFERYLRPVKFILKIGDKLINK